MTSHNHAQLKLLICLIHNNDACRLSHIKPNLKELAEDLSNRGLCVEVSEISFQPELVPFTRLNQFIKGTLLRCVQRLWRRYQGKKVTIGSFGILKCLIRELAGGAWKSEIVRKKSAVEAALTVKHIDAWRIAGEKKQITC